MRQILTVTVLLSGGLLSVSCSDSGVAPKETSAVTSNITVANTPRANVEAEIKKSVKEIETALSKNDADALDKIYAPDYTLITQDGLMQTRAERLAAIKSGDTKYESFSYSDVNVRPYGDAAVVTSIAHIKAMIKGRPLDGDFRVLSTWVKGKDGWRQVAAQTTTVKGPARTNDPKKVDMKDDSEKKETDKDDKK